MCVKEMYVEEVFVKGLRAAEMYVQELGVKERCVSADVTKRHTCHAKGDTGRCRGPSAPPDPARKCHTCQAKDRGITERHGGPSAPPGHKCHACHTKATWMSSSATPATQKQCRCHQAPPGYTCWLQLLATPAVTKLCVKELRVYVCVCDKVVCVCERVVCERVVR